MIGLTANALFIILLLSLIGTSYVMPQPFPNFLKVSLWGAVVCGAVNGALLFPEKIRPSWLSGVFFCALCGNIFLAVLAVFLLVISIVSTHALFFLSVPALIAVATNFIVLWRTSRGIGVGDGGGVSSQERRDLERALLTNKQKNPYTGVLAYLMLFLIGYAMRRVMFTPIGDVFIATDFWKKSNLVLSAMLAVALSVYAYRRYKKRVGIPPKKTITILLPILLTWMVYGSFYGLEEIITDMIGNQQDSVLEVMKDSQINHSTYGRYSGHNHIAYCVKGEAFKNVMAFDEYCGLHEEDYKLLPAQAALKVSTEQSIFGMVVNGYYKPAGTDVQEQTSPFLNVPSTPFVQ